MYSISHEVTTKCPSERYVHAAVAANLGYVPFVEDAPHSISMKVVQTPKRLEAHIEAYDENGTVVDKRTAWAPSRRCVMLVDRAAIFLLEIVDPFVPRRTEKPAPSSSSSTPDAVPTVPTAPSHAPLPSASPPPIDPPPVLRSTEPKLARRVPVRETALRSTWIPQIALFAGGGPTFWPAPEIALSFALGIEARWHRFSLGAQGHYDVAWELPTNKDLRGNLLDGGVLVCGHHKIALSRFSLRGCILGEIGRLRTGGERIRIKDSDAPIVDVGARFVAEYWLNCRFGVELQADAVYLAHNPAIRVDATEVWRLPDVNIAIRLGVLGLFDVFGEDQASQAHPKK